MINRPKYGSTEWKLYQYEQAQKARRGHNYAYFTEELGEELKAKGYRWHDFTKPIGNGSFEDREYTESELLAQEVVKSYRENGHYARIICGMHQCVQRIKSFSVAYRKK